METVNQYGVSCNILTIEKLGISASAIINRDKDTILPKGQIVKTKNIPHVINSDGYFALECIYHTNPFYTIVKTGYSKERLEVIFSSPMFTKVDDLCINEIIKENNKLSKNVTEYEILDTIIQKVNQYLIGKIIMVYNEINQEEKERILKSLERSHTYVECIYSVFKNNLISDKINNRIKYIIAEQFAFIKAMVGMFREGGNDEFIKDLISQIKDKENK